MPIHSARAVTGETGSFAGQHAVDTEATACELLGNALARCVRDSLAPLLARHDAPAITIEVRIETGAPARIDLSPMPGDPVLRQKLERAMLRCPVATQLKSPPRIQWHS